MQGRPHWVWSDPDYDNMRRVWRPRGFARRVTVGVPLQVLPRPKCLRSSICLVWLKQMKPMFYSRPTLLGSLNKTTVMGEKKILLSVLLVRTRLGNSGKKCYGPGARDAIQYGLTLLGSVENDSMFDPRGLEVLPRACLC